VRNEPRSDPVCWTSQGVGVSVDYEDSFLRLTVTQDLPYSANLDFKHSETLAVIFLYCSGILISFSLIEGKHISEHIQLKYFVCFVV